MATDTDAPDSASSTDDAEDDEQATVSKLVVWGAATLIALLGLLVTLGGLVVLSLADRTYVQEQVAEGAIQGEGLSEPELVDLTLSVLWWGGVGLIVTGALLVLGAAGLFVLQRRTGRRTDGDRVAATGWTVALLGAFVTVLTSFLPASPLLGGGVAGYLGDDSTARGAKLGGLSGLLVAVPLAVGVGFFAIGLASGMPADLPGGGRGIVATSLVIGVLFVVVLTVVLSGIGGAVGAFVADNR